MSKLWAKIRGLFSNKTMEGIDKAGNRYFTRTQHIDGILKEKRWVVFKGEDDPTSVPVEWICWLNGQRKRAPTQEEMAEMEARRERIRLNVALLKKEEEERRAKTGSTRKSKSTDHNNRGTLDGDGMGSSQEMEIKEKAQDQVEQEPESSEPMGSGASYRPGTWQPPS